MRQNDAQRNAPLRDFFGIFGTVYLPLTVYSLYAVRLHIPFCIGIICMRALVCAGGVNENIVVYNIFNSCAHTAYSVGVLYADIVNTFSVTCSPFPLLSRFVFRLRSSAFSVNVCCPKSWIKLRLITTFPPTDY